MSTGREAAQEIQAWESMGMELSQKSQGGVLLKQKVDRKGKEGGESDYVFFIYLCIVSLAKMKIYYCLKNGFSDV